MNTRVVHVNDQIDGVVDIGRANQWTGLKQSLGHPPGRVSHGRELGRSAHAEWRRDGVRRVPEVDWRITVFCPLTP
jgi:hypothetical protein